MPSAPPPPGSHGACLLTAAAALWGWAWARGGLGARVLPTQSRLPWVSAKGSLGCGDAVGALSLSDTWNPCQGPPTPCPEVAMGDAVKGGKVLGCISKGAGLPGR